MRALLHKAKELDLEPPVLRSVLASNTNQVDEAYKLIKKTGKKKIAMLGLSFKPGTDDLRESPIAELIEILIGKGHQVAIYDKEVSLARLHGANRAYIEHVIPPISCLMTSTIQDAIEGSEVVVVPKPSSEFEQRIRTMNNGHAVTDLATILADTR